MNQIEFSGSEVDFINLYDGVNHTDWNMTSGPIVAIRSIIRAHYLREQGYKCAYCRMIKREDHGMTWDVEHIIPKASYPRYLYEPLNLAMSCKECNIAKANKDVLVRAIRSNGGYPTNKEDYLIIHPHFDRYSDNIDVVNLSGRVLHIPKNGGKGSYTFIACNLVRFSYEYVGWKDFDQGLMECVSDFLDRCPDNASPPEIKRFVGMLTTSLKVDF